MQVGRHVCFPPEADIPINFRDAFGARSLHCAAFWPRRSAEPIITRSQLSPKLAANVRYRYIADIAA